MNIFYKFLKKVKLQEKLFLIDGIKHKKLELKSKIWYLENFNFFSELTLDHRTFICQNTVMKTVDKNDPVYFQEDYAHSIYFLKEGRIKISKFSEKGQEFLVTILNPGEIFGEASILGKNLRKEAALAEESATFCVMKEEKMRELLLMSPVLNLKFSQLLEERLEKTQKRLGDLSFKSNHQRIIDFIKELVQVSSEAHGGEIVINNTLTHEKIAQLTSTNRQEVSSVFSYLKRNRVIDYNRKTIRVLKIEDLARS